MLDADLLLTAYAAGVFPMAESRDAMDVHWVEPRLRGIFPLDKFHISRTLRREILRENFTIRTNADFAAVIDACADRPETWISRPLRAAYLELYARDHAHTLEVWADGALIGGVYGVVLGSAFFGESMFSRRRNASKIALAYLVCHLRRRGFTLFDTQFLTPHLASLGAVEIPRRDYHLRLGAALAGLARFEGLPLPDAQEVVQCSTQTS